MQETLRSPSQTLETLDTLAQTLKSGYRPRVKFFFPTPGHLNMNNLKIRLGEYRIILETLETLRYILRSKQGDLKVTLHKMPFFPVRP